MVLWKQYVILFGGFIDVGIKSRLSVGVLSDQPLTTSANYLSDLWIFNLEEMRWKQIEYIDKDRAPG